MARRRSKNATGIPRLVGVPYHDAWIYYACVRCRKGNLVQIGLSLELLRDVYETASWECEHCGFTHKKDAALPFRSWPQAARGKGSPGAIRFWQGFFRTATEKGAFWKQCNTCGRVLPFTSFSRHQRWGPLERQMECRACKGAINADLNPKRTAQQLHEGSALRRAADLLLKGEDQHIDIVELFRRFESRCFKTGQQLDIADRASWAVDHILPARFLYPLANWNAALLSKGANDLKRDRWPSEFYTNSELIRLATLTGANLSLLASATPIVNPNIDVNRCVTRAMRVREHSNLDKRVKSLKLLFTRLGLVKRLSAENRRLLGLD